MKTLLLTLLSLASLALFEAQPTPVWPETFFFNHTETLVNAPGVEIPGYFGVDLTYQEGSEVVYRSDGSYDHICGPLGPGDCAQIVTNGWRYIVHPTLEECCRCCSNENGCGALGTFWVDAAVYAGSVAVAGTKSDHWNITGASPGPNSLYLSVDDSRVTEITNGDADIFTANLSTYLTTVDPSLFTIPAGCDDTLCPRTVFPCNLRTSDEPINNNNKEEEDSLTAADLSRAKEWVPSNAFRGSSLPQASSILNNHLNSKKELKTLSCLKWTLSDLDQVQRWLSSNSHPELLAVYSSAKDPRKLKEGKEEQEKTWEKEREVAERSPLAEQMLVVGRCRESVMWYVHHLSTKAQQEFIELEMVLPLLPTEDEEVVVDVDDLTEEEQWAQKVSQGLNDCAQCHI